jgi:hypothetical protein
MMLLECDDLGKTNAAGRWKNCHLVATKSPGSLVLLVNALLNFA